MNCIYKKIKPNQQQIQLYRKIHLQNIHSRIIALMRLDASYLHFVSQQQLRVMTSIQLGMRNHQWVPAQVIGKISRLRGGETYKVLVKLLKNKFVVHTGKNYDGYKLTYLGYDYLALQTFIKRGILKDVVGKIGVGKQSDIYKCLTPQGDIVVLKLTRLGRNSFRSIKKNRQYIGNRTNYNWLYLSRLSSIREFLFMQLLHENNFTTPRPIDTNRHAIVMSLVDGAPLCHIQRIGTQEEIKSLFQKALAMLVRFGENGLIHGDYNEFNLITNEQGTKLTVIDFPQCISIYHPNAQQYFNRDVQCIYKFFDKMVQRQISDYDPQNDHQSHGNMQKKRFILNVVDYPMPALGEIEVLKRLDRELKTKGHITLTEEKELERVLKEVKDEQGQQLQQEEEGQGKKEQQQENQIGEQSQNNNGQQQEDENREQQEDENGKQQDEQNQEDQEQKQAQDKKKFVKKKPYLQENLSRQLKKISFDQTQGQLQQIHPTKNQSQSQPIYDKQLEALMSQLNHSNLQASFIQDPLQGPQSGSQQQQPERPQFKGLTAYQIRQKIKAQKKLQREKRKQQMNEDQYIKNAVKRTKKNNAGQANRMIGNRGNKKKNKINVDKIKYGYEMM